MKRGLDMARRSTLTATAGAVFFSVSGSVALADVTPQQVWQDWQSYLQAYGYELEATTAETDGGLQISDIRLAAPVPEDEGEMAIVIPELTFGDNGDGTVSVRLPESLPLRIIAGDDEGERLETVIDYRTAGFDMIASGDPDRITYDYSADALTLALGEVLADGEAVDLGTASMTMSDIAGQTVSTSGELLTVTQEMTSGEVVYAMDITDPETGGTAVLDGTYESMAYTGATAFPAGVDGAAFDAMLEAGFNMRGAFETGPGDSTFSFEEEGETVKTVSSSQGGTMQVTMDADALEYSGAARGLDMTVESGDLPSPARFTTDELGFDLMTPVMESERPQDFALGFTLSEFSMSENVWGMFDPDQQLPRDPATVRIDLTGEARLLVDVLDPEGAEELEEMDSAPAELTALTLNDLTVRLAGADLTGEGAFTFDNSDLESFGGFPAPLGTLNLQLVGGSALLDKLVAMGLIPQEQASGARMMLGLFARPGEGEDTLVSTIEVTEEGHVLANGQRLK